jgi:pilus assembly protein Flp/PilA
LTRLLTTVRLSPHFGEEVDLPAGMTIRSTPGRLGVSAHQGVGAMEKALQLAKRLSADEDGAALVEYTVLLGVMLVAVISTIVLVGGWVNTKWSALWTALQGN